MRSSARTNALLLPGSFVFLAARQLVAMAAFFLFYASGSLPGVALDSITVDSPKPRVVKSLPAGRDFTTLGLGLSTVMLSRATPGREPDA